MNYSENQYLKIFTSHYQISPSYSGDSRSLERFLIGCVHVQELINHTFQELASVLGTVLNSGSSKNNKVVSDSLYERISSSIVNPSVLSEEERDSVGNSVDLELESKFSSDYRSNLEQEEFPSQHQNESKKNFKISDQITQPPRLLIRDFATHTISETKNTESEFQVKEIIKEKYPQALKESVDESLSNTDRKIPNRNNDESYKVKPESIQQRLSPSQEKAGSFGGSSQSLLSQRILRLRDRMK